MTMPNQSEEPLGLLKPLVSKRFLLSLGISVIYYFGELCTDGKDLSWVPSVPNHETMEK